MYLKLGNDENKEKNEDFYCFVKAELQEHHFECN